jgi:hypothetical protein
LSTADACTKEAAWLSTSGDGLPALLAKAGGPFEVVQAYRPRTPARRKHGQLYVLRRRIRETRFANQRRMAHHSFFLDIVWPLQSGSGNAETEQAALDAAVELVLLRIGGYPGDKTHGGRFLAVAENPREVDVTFHDPATTLTGDAELRAEITYNADDQDFTG